MKKQEELMKKEKKYQGPIFNLEKRTIRLDNGKVVERDIIKHQGAVAILPLLDDENVVLVKQYREAARTELLEIPAGKLEPGEAPEECAQRELREETGFRAKEMEYLLSFYPSPGYTTEVIHIFTAKGLIADSLPADEEEQILASGFKLEEVCGLIRDGEIKDAKTIIGLLAFVNNKC